MEKITLLAECTVTQWNELGDYKWDNMHVFFNRDREVMVFKFMGRELMPGVCSLCNSAEAHGFIRGGVKENLVLGDFGTWACPGDYILESPFGIRVCSPAEFDALCKEQSTQEVNPRIVKLKRKPLVDRDAAAPVPTPENKSTTSPPGGQQKPICR